MVSVLCSGHTLLLLEESAGLRLCVLELKQTEAFPQSCESSCFNLGSHAFGINLINVDEERWAWAG